MSKLDGQQTTSSNSQPWAASQPALKTGLADAQNLYKSGVGSKVYTGSTVTPWSQQTMQGMGDVQKNATANMGGQGLSGQYQGVINSGGYNAAQQNALQNTQAVANSKFDMNADPGFKQVLDQTVNSVNANASGAGRYGSGTHQGVLAQQVGDLGARQFSNWQNRRDTANNSLFTMGQQGFGNLGAAYTGMGQPAQDLFKVGGMHEDLANRYLSDKLRIFDSSQSKPWENLGRLNAIASGAGQMGSSTTQTQPGQNPFLTALGAGSGGLGILGSFL
jgi:hypothetical protein